MELSTRTLSPAAERLSRRRVRPLAAMQAGLLGGAVALVLAQFASIVVYDEAAWKLMRMLAALARGSAVLEPADEFDANLFFVALALHFAMSMLYALAFARLACEAPRRYGTWLGLAFGVALYHANFYGFTTLFPWFTPLRTLDMLVAHAFFGVVMAKSYRFLSR